MISIKDLNYKTPSKFVCITYLKSVVRNIYKIIRTDSVKFFSFIYSVFLLFLGTRGP